MDLNKYLNETAAPETQYSKEEYAAMKKAEREAVWVQVDARMGEVLADAPALQEFLNFIIFSAISSSPPAVDTGASVVTAVWTYVGELAFNLLVLVGAIKGCDRIVKEIMGL